jgi:hypothetical protein
VQIAWQLAEFPGELKVNGVRENRVLPRLRIRLPTGGVTVHGRAPRSVNGAQKSAVTCMDIGYRSNCLEQPDWLTAGVHD